MEVKAQSDNNEKNTDGESDVILAEDVKVKKPSMYQVLMHNDDYTTMEFVIYVLQNIFSKSKEEATAIMLKIHHEGVGLCGIYTYEIAETKVMKVSKEARKLGHPLKCSIEPVDDE